MKYDTDADAFLDKFNMRVGADITAQQLETRVQHLREELTELETAIRNNDAAEQLDALVDLTYIAIGTARMQNWDFAEAWRRVHTANMQKIRAERAADSKRGTTFDVVKPADWQAADISDLVEAK
jgi:predicted HAD superfamily Cof-like phosphohydrolase